MNFYIIKSPSISEPLACAKLLGLSLVLPCRLCLYGILEKEIPIVAVCKCVDPFAIWICEYLWCNHAECTENKKNNPKVLIHACVSNSMTWKTSLGTQTGSCQRQTYPTPFFVKVLEWPRCSHSFPTSVKANGTCINTCSINLGNVSSQKTSRRSPANHENSL